jgi:hypothetical protein
MREFKQYLISLIVLTALVSGFVLLRSGEAYPFAVGPRFDPHIRQRYEERLDREQPEIVVFGDSIVETNVDPDRMTRHLGRRVSAFSEGGAGSALLHLILKNNIVKAAHKPQVLVLVFRDTALTAPGFRVNGRFFDVLEEYGGAEDDFTLRLAFLDQMGPLEKWAEAYFPPFRGRWDLRALLVTRFINLPVRLLTGCTQDCTEEAMNEVFGNQNFEADQLDETINSAENFLYSADHLDFESRIDRSFLPEIIRLCKENDIRLILVRTRTLRFTRSTPEPAALRQYLEELYAYAQAHEVQVIDLAYEDRLEAEHYKDVLHLNDRGMQIYTDLLSEAIQQLHLP